MDLVGVNQFGGFRRNVEASREEQIAKVFSIVSLIHVLNNFTTVNCEFTRQ